MTGVQICNAAELLRHTRNGWLQPDKERFERLLREILIITTVGKASKCRMAGKWLPKGHLGAERQGTCPLGRADVCGIAQGEKRIEMIPLAFDETGSNKS